MMQRRTQLLCHGLGSLLWLLLEMEKQTLELYPIRNLNVRNKSFIQDLRVMRNEYLFW